MGDTARLTQLIEQLKRYFRLDSKDNIVGVSVTARDISLAFTPDSVVTGSGINRVIMDTVTPSGSTTTLWYDITTPPGVWKHWNGIAWVATTVSGAVLTSRTLTINGTAYDLSADRTWTVSTISGNAGTATVLQTSRNIFGQAFNGSADVVGTGTFAMSAVNTSAIVITGYSLTGTSVVSMLNLAGTWNTTGIAIAILLNITNTASNVLSKFVEFQIGGAAQFSITRGGNVYSAGNIISSLTLASDSTVANANLEVYSRLVGIVHASGLAGSANTTCGVRMGGSLTSVITANYSAAGTLINARPITIGTSGTHPVFAALAIKPMTITAGAAALTNSATLYIEGGQTGATNNYAVLINAGLTKLGASTTSGASLNIPSGTAPTTPVNGDIWFDGTDIKMRIGGVTKVFTLV